MDELAQRLGIDPFELRRRNVVVPGDDFVDAHVGRRRPRRSAATASTSASTSRSRRCAAATA